MSVKPPPALFADHTVPPLPGLPSNSNMGEQTTNWDHGLEYASLSDVGLRRANNQDSVAVLLAGSREKWRQRGHLFMVADGMGAHAAGELASKLATDVIPLSYHKLVDRPPAEALAAAILDANTQINSRGRASEDFRGMGTTVGTLLLLPEGAITGHVGDSRVYRWRANRLEQLTFDHSLVWEIRAARQIPEEEVPFFVPKNVITRSLGPNPEVRVDLEGPFPIQVDDIYLLCSDGLSGPVKDEEIGKILGCLPPAEAVRALVDLANSRGGPDNITVVVVRISAPEPAASGEAKTGRSRSNAPPRPVHPALWTALVVMGLGTVGLGAWGPLGAALASLIVTVALAGVVLARRYAARQPASEFDGPPLGKGPYTTCDCTPNGEFVDSLVEIICQLRDAATSEAWTMDWSRFNAHHDRAVAAVRASDYDEAVRQYCYAISFMMSQWRAQRSQTLADGSNPAEFPW
jgi:serine/threonine protein phosphatase PrpC